MHYDWFSPNCSISSQLCIIIACRMMIENGTTTLNSTRIYVCCGNYLKVDPFWSSCAQCGLCTPTHLSPDLVHRISPKYILCTFITLSSLKYPLIPYKVWYFIEDSETNMLHHMHYTNELWWIVIAIFQLYIHLDVNTHTHTHTHHREIVLCV